MKRILEKHVEEPCVAFAKRKGLVVRKMNGLGFRAWPDRLFLGKAPKCPECGRGGRVLFVEYKRPGEVPTELQKNLHDILRAFGFEVRVTDSKEAGLSDLEAFVKGSKR